jgi:predicted NBD/HSP70 family sugar kinase
MEGCCRCGTCSSANSHIRLFVENEANMAALGESYFGAGRDAGFVLYVSAGVGMGGGIVLNKQLLQGSSGFAGEIGHMTIDPNGKRCNCGNTGCWETLVSQSAVFQRIQEAAAAGQDTTLLHDRLDRLVFADVVERRHGRSGRLWIGIEGDRTPFGNRNRQPGQCA